MDDDIDTMFDDETLDELTNDTATAVPTSEEDKEPEAPAPAPDNTPEPDAPEEPKEPEQPEEPVVDEPKPLTADEMRSIIADMRNQEYESSKMLETTEKEIMEAYYPQGLSNVLVDEKTGTEIRTPQDVVDLSDGTMTIDEATKWLMQEQYKLDKQVDEIKQSARKLAETNANFKTGATRVLEKYQHIFKEYPQLQEKVYKNYMKTVSMDNEKDLILSAPDIEDYYADIMEPYVLAFGFKGKTAPAAQAAAPQAIPVSKQTIDDRMDIGSDVGSSSGDDVDPNDPVASLNNLFGE